jgi:hypothetical protein
MVHAYFFFSSAAWGISIRVMASITKVHQTLPTQAPFRLAIYCFTVLRALCFFIDLFQRHTQGTHELMTWPASSLYTGLPQVCVARNLSEYLRM